MEESLIHAATRIGLAVLLLLCTGTYAADITVLSAVGLKPVLDELGPKFERATGHTLKIAFNPLGLALKQIHDGDASEVVILPAQGIKSLVQEGRAVEEEVRAVCNSIVVVAISKGTARPDISSPEAFKRSMLAIKSITLSDPARGAVVTPPILKVFERLGIAEEMKHKTIFTQVMGPTGIANALSEGKLEVTINQLQEFLPVTGLEIVGPLPGDFHITTPFSAVIMRGAKNLDSDRALIDFLRTPEAAAIIKSKGLEPAF
jgi:molybdate transport system substrate-binding protein